MCNTIFIAKNNKERYFPTSGEGANNVRMTDWDLHGWPTWLPNLSARVSVTGSVHCQQQKFPVL